MSDKIRGHRLTNLQSNRIPSALDYDIPAIPPLRIKLEPTGPVTEEWLRGVHGDLDGDRVMVVKMHAGGDIVRGFVGDDLSGYLENNKE